MVLSCRDISSYKILKIGATATATANNAAATSTTTIIASNDCVWTATSSMTSCSTSPTTGLIVLVLYTVATVT